MTSSRLPGHGPFPTPRQEPHDLQRAPLPPFVAVFDGLLLLLQLVAAVTCIVVWAAGGEASPWALFAVGIMGVRLVLKVGLRRG